MSYKDRELLELAAKAAKEHSVEQKYQGRAAMKDDTNNGGPAFPCLDISGSGLCLREPGMTLRDYFAAKALTAVCADYFESAQKVGFDEGWMVGVAMDAYAMADAMLKARSSACSGTWSP